uniref:Uncharacterized protein n=1 Tax=Arundo donax TaxID=35708 RepID=A0A0A9BH44_ARUDO
MEGVDFAQDTQEGGAGKFVFIPNSDDEDRSSLVPDNGEFVPEMKEQDLGYLDGTSRGDLDLLLVEESGGGELNLLPLEETGCGELELPSVDPDASTDDENSHSQEDRFEAKKMELVCAFLPGYSQILKRKRN